MEPYPQFPPSDRPNPFALQDVEQLEPKESQAILDLEDSVSKQGRFRSFRRAATVGIRRSAAECRYNDLQFQESAISVEKVHCCNGLIPFIPFSNVVNFFSVVRFCFLKLLSLAYKRTRTHNLMSEQSDVTPFFFFLDLPAGRHHRYLPIVLVHLTRE